MGETGKGRVFVALHSVNKVFGEKTTTTAITIPEAKHNSVAVSLARLGSARLGSVQLCYDLLCELTTVSVFVRLIQNCEVK